MSFNEASEDTGFSSEAVYHCSSSAARYTYLSFPSRRLFFASSVRETSREDGPETLAAQVSEHKLGGQSSILARRGVPEAHCMRECSANDHVS